MPLVGAGPCPFVVMSEEVSGSRTANLTGASSNTITAAPQGGRRETRLSTRREREVHTGGVRPSDVSRDRLSHGLHEDIADLRVRLEETILRSEAFLTAGLPQRASEVMDEQHDLLAELHDQLGGRIAAAKVEADAEHVLQASYEREVGSFPAPWDDVSAEADPLDAPTVATERPVAGVRGALSALVGALAAVAMMVIASTPSGPSTVAAASSEGDRPHPADTLRSGDEPSPSDLPDPRPTTPESSRTAGPNDLAIRKLFATPGPHDGGGTDGGTAGSDLPVLELQALVSGVVATVEDVAEIARDGWERAMTDRNRTVPQDQPAEPAPEVPEPVAPADEVPSQEGTGGEPPSGPTVGDEPEAESREEAPDAPPTERNTGTSLEGPVGATVDELS